MRVIIKEISLINWRGGNTTIEFGDKTTIISGRNGIGKSRILDAFIWVLFGKDRFDRKDHNVKTIVNGEFLKMTEAKVELVLLVDGEIIKLTRTLKEKWVKPRGQVEQVFGGNETETYWNGVPVSVTEYSKNVSELFSDNVFKMITNPLYFAEMDWKLQREQLFAIAGKIDDNEIASRDEAFVALLEELSGKSLANWRKELNVQKKALQKKLNEVQPRVDQLGRMMPEAINLEEAQEELKRTNETIAAIDRAIADKAEAKKQEQAERAQIQARINTLKSKQQEIVFSANEEEKKKAREANSERAELMSQIRSFDAKKDRMRSQISANVDDANSLDKKRDAKAIELEETREKYAELKKQEYNDKDDVCVHCGQLLPEANREKAREQYNERKLAKLEAIVAYGNGIKKEINTLTERIISISNDGQSLQNELNNIEKQIKDLSEQLRETKAIEPKEVAPRDLDEWVELEEEIQGLENKLSEPCMLVDYFNENADKKELQQKRDELLKAIDSENLRTRYLKEIEIIQEEGSHIAQEIADIEKREYTSNEFEKAKVNEVSSRVNGLFKKVQFKLFEKTIEGNEVEVCIPLVDGVPFSTANTAGRLHAGFDIIRVLQDHYNVSAPKFVDNAEGVNTLPDTDDQVIALEVSNDNEIVVTYKN
ncbi:AAA family ATPase [Porphyromonas endodontalis]